ncbi:MFS transporter [Verrucomicrobium sp. BvORR106]|uniref:MFS transporter n=1 Tax=Verrucomicrobium sp. BvORR106 TaxID=1403819 RepID=UPI00068A4B7E|nr:MFS transporter [Verrucomicrobium sp. BvORR106]
MSELLQRTPSPTVAAARRAVSWLFLLNGVLFGTWVSRIPMVQERHDLTHGSLGVALLGMALGALVAMPLSGWASARLGSRRVAAFWTVVYAAVLPCLAIAPGVLWLKLGLFLFGAGHGGLDVAMNGQAVLVERRYHRPIMSTFHALFSAGGLAGATLGAGMAWLAVPVETHFLAVAALLGGTVVLIALRPLLPDDPVDSSGTGEISSNEEVLPAKSGLASIPAADMRRLIALGLLAFCIMMGEGAMADWSGLFLKQVTGAGDGLASAGYAAFSLAMMLGRFTGDSLTVRLGSERLVRGSGILAAGGLLLALITAHPYASVLGFAAVGAGFATVIPQVFSAAGRVKEMSPGLALATVTTLGYGGFLLGPPVIGFVAEGIGLRGALGLVVLTSVCAVALAAVLRTRRSEEMTHPVQASQQLSV